MTLVKREVLASLLKLTKDGSVREELISLDARIPVESLRDVLASLVDRGLIRYEDGLIEATSLQRIEIAVYGAELGVDLERICKHLRWDEFEDVAAIAFESCGYLVRRLFRFKSIGRRWEIDILALKRPHVICVDCKRLRRGWSRSIITKAVESQVVRAEALSKLLPSLREDLRLDGWEMAYVVPMILSLLPAPFKFHRDVPIVPVLQLRDFLNEMPAHALTLLRFKVGLSTTAH